MELVHVTEQQICTNIKSRSCVMLSQSKFCEFLTDVSVADVVWCQSSITQVGLPHFPPCAACLRDRHARSWCLSSKDIKRRWVNFVTSADSLLACEPSEESRLRWGKRQVLNLASIQRQTPTAPLLRVHTHTHLCLNLSLSQLAVLKNPETTHLFFDLIR